MNSGKRDTAMAPNLHMQQLAYLREIARSGSFREAAASLAVSQPALSQGVAELERRLDVKLFEAKGRGRVLTSEGCDLAEFAQRTLAEAAELMARFRAARQGSAGRLAVGMIDAASLYMLPDALRRFRSERSAVELTLVVADTAKLMQRLGSFELDLVFATGPVAAQGFRSQTILEEKLYIYGPAEAAGEVDGAEWLLYPSESHTRQIIDAALAVQGITPNVVLESGNPQVLVQMVRLGFGLSVLPAGVAGTGQTKLRRITRTSIATRSLLAVWRESSDGDARVAAFVQSARDHGRRS